MATATHTIQDKPEGWRQGMKSRHENMGMTKDA